MLICLGIWWGALVDRQWHQSKGKQAERPSRDGEDKVWALESFAQVTHLDAVMGTQQDPGRGCLW